MIHFLTQKQWFRNLFQNKTFFKSSGVWFEIKDFKEGIKIEKIDGNYRTAIYCSCGNELVHSNSFWSEFESVKTKYRVWKYCCSFCHRIKYFNPDIAGMAIIESDENGIPKTNSSKNKA